MEIYVICEDDIAKLASKPKGKTEDAKLIVFGGGAEGLSGSFKETVLLPEGEKIQGLRQNVTKGDILFLAGPSIKGFYSNNRGPLLDMSKGIAYSNTLCFSSDGGNPKIQWSKGKKTQGKGNSQVESIDLSDLMMSVMDNVAEQEPGSDKETPQVIRQDPDHNAKSGQHKKTTIWQNDEQKAGKRALEEQSYESSYEEFYTEVENAKAELSSCLIDRIHHHICDLCCAENDPFPHELTVQFMVVLLRAKEIAESKDGGDDMVIRNFKDSWKVMHFDMEGMDSKALSVLLPEARYYWELTETMYEKDKWDNI